MSDVEQIHGAKAAEALSRFGEKVGFLWSIAELLRGDFKAHQYGSVILPFTVLRRLDQVLAPTREAVRAEDQKFADKPERLRQIKLCQASQHNFFNTSPFDLEGLLGEPKHVAANLRAYIAGFSQNARDVVEKFGLDPLIDKLHEADLLYQVLQRFAQVDLHPDRVSNLEMGYVFEELIRKFAEQSNETAGEHFTPREVIRLMVNLLFEEDDQALTAAGVVRSIFDPACGTGGMLSVAQEYLGDLHPQATLKVYGQEINPETYAICKADMLIKGQDDRQIQFGNSLSDDQHPDLTVDYLISNPPFGVDWSKVQKQVKAEHEQQGHAGRFGPGLPPKSDGSLLFLLHMLKKMKPARDGGSRLAIVFNGSPLFSGAAGSGSSEIRRHLLENDLLEAIVSLPDQMFYNTGINTYVWVITNRKPKPRRGKVQLIHAVDLFRKMRKSLGNKRKELAPEHLQQITDLFTEFKETEHSKIFDNEDFGFHRITVERPLRLDFRVTPERRARLDDQPEWQRLVQSKKKNPDAAAEEIAAGKTQQEEAQRVLDRLLADALWLDRATFEKDLAAAAKKEGVKFKAPVKKAILNALGERNEEAKPCLDKKGQPEPDPELRDAENVPLKEAIDDYMAREVLPHVPDAWVDESKTKVGYEIPFTRHFYEYTPPRPLEAIEEEIRALEEEIQGMLGEVLG